MKSCSMDGGITIDNINFSIFDDINTGPTMENIKLNEDSTDILMVMDKQDIEYEVTLHGFWDDMDGKVWKSIYDRKYYKIDKNNYAIIMEKTEEQLNSEPPAFSITMIAKQNVGPQKRRKTE